MAREMFSEVFNKRLHTSFCLKFILSKHDVLPPVITGASSQYIYANATPETSWYARTPTIDLINKARRKSPGCHSTNIFHALLFRQEAKEVCNQ